MNNIQDLLDDNSRLEIQALEAYREKRKELDEFQRLHKHERTLEDKIHPVARYWYTDSVVLFVTRRECSQCGHTSLMPEPDLMVKSINYQRHVTEIVAKPLGLIPPHIRREIIYHDLPPTKACSCCFKGMADTNQLDLFNPRLDYPTHSEYPEGTPEMHYRMEDL